MKHGNKHYIQLSRKIFNHISHCRASTKWLFVVLNELEHRYADKQGWFYRSNDNLVKDAGLSHNTIFRDMKELLALGVIEKKRKPLIYANATRKSKHTINCFKILL